MGLIFRVKKCSKIFLKYVIFCCNAIFVIFALVFIILGIIYKANISGATAQLQTDYGFSLPSNLAIAVGSFILLISLLGCFGARKEIPCMLLIYALILLILFFLQMAAAIYSFLQYRNVKDENNHLHTKLSKELQKLMQKYNSNNPEIVAAMDSLQYNFKCCGVKGPKEWESITGSNAPSSCCTEKPKACPIDTKAYDEGCLTKLTDYIERSVRIIAIILVVIATVEVACSVMAICLSSLISQVRNN